MGTGSNGVPSTDSRSGVLYGLVAYGWWGLMPLYFAAVSAVPPGEILAQRIVWCGLLLLVVLTLSGRWEELRTRMQSSRVRFTFVLTALLLSTNWIVYIHGVTTGRTVETSLGYFINPLLNVLLGVLIFRERLRPGQGIAVLLATAGVMLLVVSVGEVPWIALTLATSFALYGLLRKQAPADALLGLSIETFVMVPFALAYLGVLIAHGTMTLGRTGLTVDLLILASGVVTAIPLFCFGHAARKLRLSTLGLLQFLAPSVQFLLAVVYLQEHVTAEKWRSFALIWAGLAVYSFDSWWNSRGAGGVVIPDCDGGAEVEPVSQTD